MSDAVDNLSAPLGRTIPSEYRSASLGPQAAIDALYDTLRMRDILAARIGETTYEALVRALRDGPGVPFLPGDTIRLETRGEHRTITIQRGTAP